MSASLSGFESHAVAGLEAGHAFSDADHFAGGFVTEHKRRLDNVVADASGFIIMYVRPADAYAVNFHQNFSGSRYRDFSFGQSHFADAVHHGYFHHFLHGLCILFHCNANFRLNNHFGIWHTIDVSAPEGMLFFCIPACLFLRFIGFRYVNLWQIKHPVQRFNIFNFRNRSRNRMR